MTARARTRSVIWVVLALLSCAPLKSAKLPEPERPALALAVADADVWAFTLHMEAELHGADNAQDCVFMVQGEPQQAQVEGRRLRAELALSPGRNRVAARCQLAGGARVESAEGHFDVRLRDAPYAVAHLELSDSELVLDATASQPSARSQAAIVAFAWFEELPRGEERALGSGARISLPARDGPARFLLRIRDALGAHDLARTVLTGPPGDLHELARDEGPSWLAEAVLYGVIPPLYGAPPLAALRAALPTLAELGVSALWLSPLFATTPDDYGYAVVDPLRVRSDYGDEQELSALVADAHRRGLRVLLDLVPNHSSNRHPYFVQAEQLGRRSHYFDFYERDAQGAPTHYFDWEHLPNLDYDHPEVGNYSLEVALHWIRAAGIDGYRVDAAWGIKQRAPGFWPLFQRELKRVQPEALLLAEAHARDPYYLSHGFDAAYDWGTELGRHAWEHVFENPRGIAHRLDQSLAGRPAHERARTLRFLNNNDTGQRFIARHGEPLTRVATAALLTLPGVPCLYAFDEVGAHYQPYEELTPVRAENPDLRAFHEELIALRRSEPSLQGEGFTVLHVSGEHEAYAFTRTDGVDHALVLLNFGAEERCLTLSLPAALAGKRLEEPISRRSLRTKQASFAPCLGGWDIQIWLARR